VKSHNDIIFIFDPDMILLKPITHEFGNGESVIDGKPYAQKYGYGSGWLRNIQQDIPSLWNDNGKASAENHKDSILHKLSYSDAGHDYAVGPPYIGTINDIYSITKLWCKFVPNVYKLHPHLLAEMFAYSASAAHLKLPHMVKTNFMVSDVGMGNMEGWDDYFDNNKHIKDETLCEDVMKLNDEEDVPFVMHYCQRYMIGQHFFGKKRLPTPFFTCEMKYLLIPPAKVSLLYDYKIPPRPHRPPGEHKPMNQRETKRNAIAVCLMTKKVNEALHFFKMNHCDGSDSSFDVNAVDVDHSLDLWK